MIRNKPLAAGILVGLGLILYDYIILGALVIVGSWELFGPIDRFEKARIEIPELP